MREVETFWNGRPCLADIGSVIVGEPLAKSWWCAAIVGLRVQVVRVRQGGKRLFLMNEAYTCAADTTVGRIAYDIPAQAGWAKVLASHEINAEPYWEVPVDDSSTWIPDAT